MNDFWEKVKKEISNTVAIDFDGVIHTNSKGYHDGTIYDVPIPGVKNALEFLSGKYNNLIIYTCKADPNRVLINGKTGIELIWEWLDKYDLKKYIKDIVYEKPRAAFYIDDKAIEFKNWKDTLSKINELCDNLDNDISKF